MAKTSFLIFIITIIFFVISDNILHVRQSVSNDIFHHSLPKNSSFQFAWGDQTHTVCTDKNGFKIKCGDKSFENYDIAIIGDSFIQGIGNYEETLVGYISNHYNDKKILNLGVASYSPTIYYEKIKYYLEKGLNFSHLVVYIDISDIQDEVIYFRDKNKVKTKYILSENNNLIKKNLTRKLKDTIKKIIPFSYEKLSKLKRKYQNVSIIGNPYKKYDNRSSWTYNKDIIYPSGWNREMAINKSLNEMEKLYQLLIEKKIKLSLGVYPWPHQLIYDSSNSLQVKIWQNFCIDRCVSFINSFDTFFEIKNSNGLDFVLENYYIKDDVHFNKYGDIVLFEDFVKSININ